MSGSVFWFMDHKRSPSDSFASIQRALSTGLQLFHSGGSDEKKNAESSDPLLRGDSASKSSADTGEGDDFA